MHRNVGFYHSYFLFHVFLNRFLLNIIVGIISPTPLLNQPLCGEGLCYFPGNPSFTSLIIQFTFESKAFTFFFEHFAYYNLTICSFVYKEVRKIPLLSSAGNWQIRIFEEKMPLAGHACNDFSHPW